MHLIVLPTETLCYPNPSPFWLRKQSEGARFLVEKVFRNESEELLWENYVTILICVVGVSIRVVDPGLMINAFFTRKSG